MAVVAKSGSVSIACFTGKIINLCGRYFVRPLTISTSTENTTPEILYSEHQERSKRIYKHSENVLVNNKDVFTNMELSLKYISVYGFDFDYTLVQYTQEVLSLIYNLAKQKLVKELSYPSPIESLEYDPNFAIRGLHLDIHNGLLMKMDANHHIQLGSVYKGRCSVSNDEVTSIYGGIHVPLYILDDQMHAITRRTNAVAQDRIVSRKLMQFLDWFSNPEVTLFADISDYFYKQGIPFDPEYLYNDVKSSIRECHTSNEVHRIIAQDPDRYIEDSSSAAWDYLLRLKRENKKLFILTNSPFWFVDKVMKHITKACDWMDLFDVVVCSARKPDFYDEDSSRPFRLLNVKNSSNNGNNVESLSLSWKRIDKLEPGLVYNQGNIKEFVNLTGWKGGSQVLYIGDHVYSDLSNPNLHLGWNTVAIIPELNAEIEKGNSTEYKEGLANLLALERMLNEVQGDHLTNPLVVDVIENWKKERNDFRKRLKDVSNPYFGSIFRTERGPTYFSRRLMRFASLYTSTLSNLQQYSTNHTFYARRAALPHEPDFNFNY